MATVENSLRGLGHAPQTLAQTANGLLNHTLNTQAAILAYIDVFSWTSVAAFCMVPLALLYRATQPAGRGAPAH